MKPLFITKTRAWFVVLLAGVVLAGAGLWQAPQGTEAVKGLGAKGESAAGVQSDPQQKVSNGIGISESALPKEFALNLQQAGQSGNSSQAGKSVKQNEVFVEYRLERDRTRSQQIDLFREIVNNQNSPEETRKEAQRQLLAITQALDTEMKLETLIKAENFKDAVVFVQDKNVTVIVETPVLTAMDKNRLTDLAVRVTGFTRESVVVIAKQ